MRHLLVYWLPVLAWMALIFVMSTSRFSFAMTSKYIEPFLRFLLRKLTPNGVVRAHMKVREAAHFGEYLVLSLLVFRALRGENDLSWRSQWMWYSLVIVCVYAVLDEYHQKWEAGRTARFKHVFIDVVGGVAGQALIFLCASLGR